MIYNSDQWQLINTGFHSGIFNMKYDEDLAMKLQRQEIPPTIRIYGWTPWAISLGYNQKETDVNGNQCQRDGVDVVRRPTGGRAILHANEITYSIVMFAEGKSVNKIYSEISQALVSGLRKFHPMIGMESSQPHFPTLYKNAESFPCFASSARYEIQFEGRKLVGSAQRRFSSAEYPEVVLQHGSILLGPEHKKLTDYFNVSDSKVITRIQEDFERKTIDLESIMHQKVSFDDAAEAVVKGFEEEWRIKLRHFIKEVV